MTLRQAQGERTAVFGGGCFWCTEAVFRMLKGVLNVESGYAGGNKENPSYESVSSGDTCHAEVIRVTYDPAVITYDDLLTVFFGSHDPTTPNRQGADVGTQYRSVIFVGDEHEEQEARAKIQEIQESLKPARPDDSGRSGGDGSRVVTEVLPLDQFFPAESYHQNYFKENTSASYCQLIIEPKIEKVKKRFAELVK